MVPKLSPGAWVVVGLVAYAAAVWAFWEPVRPAPVWVVPARPAVVPDRPPAFGLFGPGFYLAYGCALLLAGPVLVIRHPVEALTLLHEFIFRVPTPGGGCG